MIKTLSLIQEGQLSVSGERICTILVNRFNRGLSLPSKRVARKTDRARHDPIGLTGPLNLNTNKQTQSRAVVQADVFADAVNSILHSSR